MNTNDKTPPADTVEEEFSAEEKGIHEAETKLSGKHEQPIADGDLPKVNTDQGV